MSGWMHMGVAWLFRSPSKGRTDTSQQRVALCPASPQPLANIGEIPLSGGCSLRRRRRNLAAVLYPAFALQKNHPLQWAVTPSYRETDPALDVLKPRCSQVSGMARGLQLSSPLPSQTTPSPKHMLQGLAMWSSSPSHLSLRSVEEVPVFNC